MSHQSGITASDELLAAIASSYNDTKLRCLKVSIRDEKLVHDATIDAEGDERHDFDNAVLANIEPETPCYLLFRLDSQNSSGYNFILICYSPDFAHVRQKMLYASTRSTLKSLFGTQYIRDELFGTVPADVSLEGYDKHMRAEAAPPPLTIQEVEKAEIRAVETGVDIGASSRRSCATGIQFPVNADATAQLEALKAGSVTYVQLGVDLVGEKITLVHAADCDADEAGATIPSDEARYNLINFKHNHEGDNLQSIVFAYSCPGYKLPVKARMLYASCKPPLLEYLEQDMGITIACKMEITDGSEFNKQALYDQLHPAKVVFKQKFARPKPPGKAGSRRLNTQKSDGGDGDGE